MLAHRGFALGTRGGLMLASIADNGASIDTRSADGALDNT